MSGASLAPRRQPISRISIVTPCRNARDLLPRTIDSVLSQTAVRSGRIELEYVICDGASTDGTAELARELCQDRAVVLSAPDRSMYDALVKGLRRVTGDVVAYLNAGDLYSPAALDVVADVFDGSPTRWLTGCAVMLNARWQMVSCALPCGYSRPALRRGVYGTWLPFVQQESTFWDRSLHQTLDLDFLSRLRLAGDAYLWSRFAEHEDLWVVESYLGGFTQHGGHLSGDLTAYRAEAKGFLEAPGPIDRVRALRDSVLWRCPAGLKKAVWPERVLRFDAKAGKWA